MRRPQFFLALTPLLAAALSPLALASCDPLKSLPAGVCGNGVVDAENGEDCDGPTGTAFDCRPPDVAWPCALSCDAQGKCPQGYGCGADSVCRLPIGTFQTTPFVQGPSQAQELYSANFDADGRADLLGVEPGRAQVHFVDDKGALQQTSVPVLTRPAIGRLGALANPDEGEPLDVTDDLLVSLNIGVGAFLSGGDRTFSPITYGSIAFGDIPFPLKDNEPPVLSRVVKALPVAFDAVGGVKNPGDETAALLGVSPNDGQTTNDGFFASFNAAGSGLVFRVPDGAPNRLTGAPVWADFDHDGCQEIVFPVGPPPGAPVDFVSKVAVYKACVHKEGGDVMMAYGDGVDPVISQIDAGGVLSGAIFVYDENHDSEADLLLSVKAGDKTQLRVAYSLGNGKFNSTPPDSPQDPPDQQTSVLATLDRPPLAVGDYNGDEHPDVIDAASLLLGDAGFLEPLKLATIYQSSRLWTTAYFADMNADGHPDVAACADGAPGIDVLIGNETSYPNPLQISTDGTVANLTVGDFDGDLVTDLVFQDALSSQSSLLMVSYGRTSGGPEEPSKIGDFRDIQAIASGNTLALGADSISDLGVVSTIAGELSLSFFPGSGNRLMQTPYLLTVTPGPDADPEDAGKIHIPLETQMGTFRQAAEGEEVQNDIAIVAYSPPDFRPDDTDLEKAQRTLRAFRLWGLFGAGEGLFEGQQSMHCRLPEGAVSFPNLRLATSIMIPQVEVSAAAPVWVAMPFVELPMGNSGMPEGNSGITVSTMVARAHFDGGGTCGVDDLHFTDKGLVLMRGRAVDLDHNGEPDLMGILTTFSDGYLAGLIQSNSAPGDGSFQGITGAKLVIVWDGALGSTDALSFDQPDGQPEVVNDYAVGDIDGDGRPEIIAAGRGTTAVYSVAPGGGALVPGPKLALDLSDARSLLLADADGDGALDLAVSSGSQLQVYKGDTKAPVEGVISSP